MTMRRIVTERQKSLHLRVKGRKEKKENVERNQSSKKVEMFRL